MAFRSALLPTLAAATAEAWPSIAKTPFVPLRALTPTAILCDNPPSSSHPHPPLSTMPSSALSAVASPLAPRLLPAPMRRLFSTASPLAARPHALFPFRLAPSPLLSQQRGFAIGGISRNMLANLEAAANRNPGSPTAQNAFYQVLLRANMPAIVVERYNSGRYAKNQAVDDAYAKALAMLSGNKAGAAAPAAAQNNSGLSNEQLQAVAQAVAARTHGASIAVSAPSSPAVAKDGRIHVQLDQSLGDLIWKWGRFLLVFALCTYLSFTGMYALVESANSIRRPGGSRGDAEVKAESQKARFADVHGCDEAKEELQELVEFLKNPGKFSTLGGKLPKGVLLVGPPGTGKTLLARAVAGEAGVPFFYMSGSEFDEIYVGVGAKRVRELFNSARAKSPAIIFIDELDAIGGKRNSRDSTYAKQTLNQLLTELDGFDQSSQVIIIAATNFPQLLDQALTRPGRFDRHVQVDLPDVRGRLAILKYHAKKIKLVKGLDLKELAQGTPGMSGAELENIINSAAIHASKTKSPVVTMKDLIWAKDKILMGAEKKSMVLTEEEKLMTAYHEAGHALMCLFGKTQSSRLYKVTILPRGQSLGHTAYLPEMDKYSWTSADFVTRIEMAYGGMVAEELVYGQDMVTSGASSDLESATSTAFAMVSQYGMGRGLAPMNFDKRYEHLSPATRAQVENEVQRLLNEALERTRAKLKEKRKELDLLAHALIEYETLSTAEVLKVINGESLPDRIKMPKDAKLVVPATPNPVAALPPPLGGGRGEDHGPPGAPPAPPAVA